MSCRVEDIRFRFWVHTGEGCGARDLDLHMGRC